MEKAKFHSDGVKSRIGGRKVKELAKYLLQNLQIDFKGDIALETVRDMLRQDGSQEANALLAKIIEDKGVDDLLIVLADCLGESITQGINDKLIEEQLMLYSES